MNVVNAITTTTFSLGAINKINRFMSFLWENVTQSPGFYSLFFIFQDAQNWDEVVCYSVIGRQWGAFGNIAGGNFLPICDLQPNKGIKMEEYAKYA